MSAALYNGGMERFLGEICIREPSIAALIGVCFALIGAVLHNGDLVSRGQGMISTAYIGYHKQLP